MSKTMLNEVHGNEERLLLYAANELSPADRAQMDEILQQNQQLQSMLAQLRRLDEQARTQLEASPLETPDVERAIRRAQLAMRNAADSRRPSVTAVQPPDRLPLPWWMYPMAAAAAILVAAAIFVANRTPRTLAPPYASPMASIDVFQSEVDVSHEMSPSDAYALAEDLAASFDDSEHLITGSRSNQLMAASKELDEIRASSRAFGYLVTQ